MDLWSRKTVGCHAGDTLEAEGALRALKMALENLPRNASPIRHSDRGCQYCPHLYVGKLRGRGLAVSMTEELHCCENANAERLNGILKREYGLGVSLRTKKQALRAVDEAALLYNTRRPHLALNYETPENMHRKSA
jgi:transposase InsO family protein